MLGEGLGTLRERKQTTSSKSSTIVVHEPSEHLPLPDLSDLKLQVRAVAHESCCRNRVSVLASKQERLTRLTCRRQEAEVKSKSRCCCCCAVLSSRLRIGTCKYSLLKWRLWYHFPRIPTTLSKRTFSFCLRERRNHCRKQLVATLRFDHAFFFFFFFFSFTLAGHLQKSFLHPSPNPSTWASIPPPNTAFPLTPLESLTHPRSSLSLHVA